MPAWKLVQKPEQKPERKPERLHGNLGLLVLRRAPFAVSDGKLVTGQNPASSTLTAQKALEAAGL